MKKYSKVILFTLLSTTVLFSCKKSDSSKDYVASIKDKTWVGEITYTGDSTQFYSVQFNADFTLLWSQFSGDYPGNWGIDGKQITMTFNGNSAIIRADITDDNKFINTVVSNTNSYIVNSGALLANPNIPLEGTIWKGNGYFSIPTTYPYQMSFLPGSKVEIKINNIVKPLYVYTRSASGSFIRFNVGSLIKYFGVLTSDNQMKGSYGVTTNPSQVTKQ